MRWGWSWRQRPPNFVERSPRAYGGCARDRVNPWAVGCRTTRDGPRLLAWPRAGARACPGPLVALLRPPRSVAGVLRPAGGDHRKSRFGAVPSVPPDAPLAAHRVGPRCSRTSSQPAVSIALLAGIESLLTAVVADGMTGRQHRPERGARRAGRRQPRLAALRRHPGHRRHRPHRDERQERGPDPRRRASSTPLTLLLVHHSWWQDSGPRSSRWPLLAGILARRRLQHERSRASSRACSGDTRSDALVLARDLRCSRSSWTSSSPSRWASCSRRSCSCAGWPRWPTSARSPA